MDHFEIGEGEVFVDISVSRFNFADMSSVAPRCTLRCANTGQKGK